MRRTTWILWLMLALLPLRGWAAAGMALPVLPAQAVAAQDGAARDRAPPAAVPACHQAARFDGGTAADSGAGTSSCQACDWCHAALGLAPPVADALAPPRAAAPLPSAGRDTGRAAIGGLERPPRIVPA